MNIAIKKHHIGNEIINSVNARDIYLELGIKKDFSDWIKQQIKALFLDENIDYMVYHQKGGNLQGGRPTIEYIVTLDTAKHIAMSSRTKKGKEVRDYFIKCEKQLLKQSRKSIKAGGYSSEKEKASFIKKRIEESRFLDKKYQRESEYYKEILNETQNILVNIKADWIYLNSPILDIDNLCFLKNKVDNLNEIARAYRRISKYYKEILNEKDVFRDFGFDVCGSEIRKVL